MSTTKDIDRLLKALADQRELPGVSLSVYHGDEQLYEGYYGYQDMARTIPLTPKSMFRVYSMTKPISALCGLIQHERGYFLMDDPVSEFLPEYKHLKLSIRRPDGSWGVEDSKEPMLMKHLFNMNVGFYAHDDSPTARGMDDMIRRLGGTKFQGDYDHLTEIRELPSIPMLFEPGTRWQYGYGLDIMAAVVEVTSGKSIGTFMKENIFDPCGMKETAHFFRPGWKERLMDCVERLPNGSVKLCTECLGDPIDACHRPEAKYESASAGLLSTLRDYQKFCIMLANGGTINGEHVVGRKTIEMMRQNLLTGDLVKDFADFGGDVGSTRGYGYGYGVRTLLDPAAAFSNGSVGEFGWVGAAGSWMMVDPVEKLSAVFVMQEMLPNDQYYHPRIRNAVNGLLR